MLEPPRRHWQVIVGSPVTAMVKLAVPPEVTVGLLGCIVNDGGVPTPVVTLKGLLVTFVAPVADAVKVQPVPVPVGTMELSVAFPDENATVFPVRDGLVGFPLTIGPHAEMARVTVPAIAGLALTQTAGDITAPETVFEG